MLWELGFSWGAGEWQGQMAWLLLIKQSYNHSKRPLHAKYLCNAHERKKFLDIQGSWTEELKTRTLLSHTPEQAQAPGTSRPGYTSAYRAGTTGSAVATRSSLGCTGSGRSALPITFRLFSLSAHCHGAQQDRQGGKGNTTCNCSLARVALITPRLSHFPHRIWKFHTFLFLHFSWS